MPCAFQLFNNPVLQIMFGPHRNRVADIIPRIQPTPIGGLWLPGLFHVFPALQIIVAVVVETDVLEWFTPGIFRRRLPFEHLFSTVWAIGTFLCSHCLNSLLVYYQTECPFGPIGSSGKCQKTPRAFLSWSPQGRVRHLRKSLRSCRNPSDPSL